MTGSWIGALDGCDGEDFFAHSTVAGNANIANIMHKTVTNNLIYELKFIAIFFVKKLDIGKIRDIRKKKQNKFKISQFKVKKVTQLYANKVKSTSNNEANGFFSFFCLN